MAVTRGKRPSNRADRDQWSVDSFLICAAEDPMCPAGAMLIQPAMEDLPTVGRCFVCGKAIEDGRFVRFGE